MSVLDEVEALRVEEEVKAEVVTEKVPVVAENTVQVGLEKAIGRTIDEGKEIKDLAKDLTYLKGASDLQTDDDFRAVYQQELGKQLVSDLKDEGKRQAVVNAARKQEARNIRSQTFYDSMKPIFKTLGIDSPFGLIAMVITSVLLMIPYLMISLVMFVINSINGIFTAIAKFSKPAMWICGIIVCLAITAGVVLSILYGVDVVFGTNIFGKHIQPHI